VGGKGVKDLAVDHNHKTGQVRQLLCHRCNVILGFAEKAENLDLLSLIHRYQERHKELGG